jgi:hypothetical protein
VLVTVLDDEGNGPFATHVYFDLVDCEEFGSLEPRLMDHLEDFVKP